MSQEDVEIVRKVYDAWSRSDPSQAFDLKTEIHYAAVYTFRGGKVFTVKEYNTCAEALAAVGASTKPE